jgi:hypothetical protein
VTALSPEIAGTRADYWRFDPGNLGIHPSISPHKITKNIFVCGFLYDIVLIIFF